LGCYKYLALRVRANHVCGALAILLRQAHTDSTIMPHFPGSPPILVISFFLDMTQWYVLLGGLLGPIRQPMERICAYKDPWDIYLLHHKYILSLTIAFGVSWSMNISYFFKYRESKVIVSVSGSTSFLMGRRWRREVLLCDVHSTNLSAICQTVCGRLSDGLVWG
jgi:hypothetical protein